MKTNITSIDILQLVFIYLKLTNQIDWSWWAVMIPTIVIVIVVVLAHKK